MSALLAFVDTETTGLDPDLHEIWEVALILRDEEGVEVDYCWQLPVDLGKADPMALSIGRWYERRWEWSTYPSPYSRAVTTEEVVQDIRRADAAVEGRDKFVVPWNRIADWCALFAELTNGAHLVGAVISFDEERLRRLLRRHQACPTWHYHLVDVEALAAGWIACETGYSESACGPAFMFDPTPPWKSEDLSRAVGVDPDRFDRHTALGDARWAQAIYEAVMEGKR